MDMCPRSASRTGRGSGGGTHAPQDLPFAASDVRPSPARPRRRDEWRDKHLRCCGQCGRVWRRRRRKTCPGCGRADLAMCLTCDRVTPEAAIVKSVLRYRDQWRARGWNVPKWIKRQADRGRRNTRGQQRQKGIRSGEVRRERTRERDRRILARLKGGQSTRAVAAAQNLPPSTVQSIHERSRGCTTNYQHR